MLKLGNDNSFVNLMRISNFSNNAFFQKPSIDSKFKTNSSDNKNKCINKISLGNLMNNNSNFTTSLILSEKKTSKKTINNAQILKYMPKRLMKITGHSEIPFRNMGGSHINYDKLFSPLSKANKAKTDSKKLIEQEINFNNDAEFRNAYILKNAKISDNFNKFENNKDLFSKVGKEKFEELFVQLSKLIEKQIKNCFDFDDFYNNTNNNMVCVKNHFDNKKLSFHTTATDNLSSKLNSNFSNSCMSNSLTNTITVTNANNYCYLDTNANFNTNINSYKNYKNNSCNGNNISPQIKKFIISWYNYSLLINKLITLIFTEFRECKSDNTKIRKKIVESEIKCAKLVKKFEQNQENLCKLETNSNTDKQKLMKEQIDKQQNDFKIKENEYIIEIYKLQAEIINLTSLLDKTKNYFDKYLASKVEIEGKNKKISDLRNEFNNELQSATINITLQRDSIDELNDKIQKYEDEISLFKKGVEENKKVDIERTTHIKKLEMVLMEKDENIVMMNEELEWFRGEYDRERMLHSNTKNELKILEARLYKDLNDDKIKDNNTINNVNSKNNRVNNSIEKGDK